MKQGKGFSRDFWLVVAGQIISLFGNAIMRFALPVHLLNVTGSAAVLGVVSGCAFIPLAVMSPIGGIIADRVNKRNIMVFLDFFTSGLTIAFLVLYGRVDATGLILVMLFLLYGISGAYQPSVQASIPALAENEKVMSASAVINMVSSLSGILGPALGGVAYGLWGIYPVLAVSACCFFLSAVMECFIRMPHTKRERKASVFSESKEDLRLSLTYISRERTEIAKLTLCCAGVNLVMSALLIIGLPVIVLKGLGFAQGEASRLYGFMETALAVGGLAGGIGAGVLGPKLKVTGSWKLLAFASLLLVPMGGVLMAGLPAFVTYVVLSLTGMLIMALAAVYTIQVMAYIQITVPQDMVGKVIAWIIAVSTCAQPVGQMAYGFLFQRLRSAVGVIFLGAALLSFSIACYSRKASAGLETGAGKVPGAEPEI